MKATFIFGTLLAFAATIAAIGQTQNSQAIPANNSLKPVIKHSPVAVNENAATEPLQGLAQFRQRMDEINQKISELEAMKSQVNEQINQFFTQSIKPSEADASMVSSLSAVELIKNYEKQAESLLSKSNTYSLEARAAKGAVKKEYLSKARETEQQALSCLINVSVLNGKINLEKYTENAEVISVLLRDFRGNKSKMNQMNELVGEAARYMRIANEMRIEAEDLSDLAAKLGALQNSDEKEYMALEKQNSVLYMFGGNLCSN